jgi:alpha-aminoadipic semialdehyde synthase
MLLPRRLQLARRVPRDTRLLTTLGIRREDPARIWERRVPLTPQAVATLLEESKGVASGSKDELRVQVESCKRRCFADSAYVQVSRVDP